MLLATAANALRATFAESGGHLDPVTISAYYLSATRPGRAMLRTEVLRSGRSMSTGSVSLLQAEGAGQEPPVERLRALATFGDLDGLPDDVRTTAIPPDLPPPERCVSTSDAPPSFMEQAGLLERLDPRLDPACVGWAVGKPSGRA